jgi:predicted phosphodiesterase
LRAIISDIHGNLEALEAVLTDIRGQEIKEIYCLGDIIGYGPNPRECIDLVMKNCQVTILGNHDQAALFDPEGFNAGAERAIFWTRHMLESGDAGGNERRWEFLGELPRMRREGEVLFVHGSARNPLNEYVFPEDIYNQRKMERIFGLVDHFCFQGHTHIPGVFTEDATFQSPDEFGHRWKLAEPKVLVNVGSVGQPRDGNNKACYVVLHPVGSPGAMGGEASTNGGQPASDPAAGFTAGTVIEYRRVPYEFEKTIAKIYAIPELDNFLGDRLRDGR